MTLEDFFNPQTITSGGYAMESMAWLVAAVMVNLRTIVAAWKSRSRSIAISIFSQRGSKFAFYIGVLFMFGLYNRGKWWVVHTFTDRAFVNVNYVIALTSLGITVTLFLIVAHLNGREDTHFGMRNSRILALLAVMAFILSSLYYASYR